MKSIRTYIAGFFAGLLAGAILVERWRRMGSRLIAAADETVQSVDATTADRTQTASAAKPKSVASVVAGAKADAGRARQAVNDVVSRSSSPVHAESTAGV